MPTIHASCVGVALIREPSAYSGSTGMTMPKPTMSMNSVRKMSASGERGAVGAEAEFSTGAGE